MADNVPLKDRTLKGYIDRITAPSNSPGNIRESLRYTNYAAARSLPVTPQLESDLRQMVREVYGPGYTVEVYSGGQVPVAKGGKSKGKGRNRVGTSVNHDDGNAADVYVKAPDGKIVRGAELAKAGQWWGANKKGQVGLEMRGGGIHLGKINKENWDYDNPKDKGVYTPEQRELIGFGYFGRDYRQKPNWNGVSAEGYAVNYDPTSGRFSVDTSEVVGPVKGQNPFGPMLYTDEPRARAIAAGNTYSGLRNPVDPYPTNDFRAPAPGLSTPRVTPVPSFSLGDRVVTDAPNTVGGGILSAAQAIGNFAGNVYARAQDAAPRPPQGVPQSPLERLRSMSIGRNPFDTQQGAAAPVTPVQRSPLAAPQAPKTDALSRLRSMISAAQVNGDMRAAPGPSPAGTYAIGADSYSKQMAAQQANAKYSITSGGSPQLSTPTQPRTPRDVVRAFGRATAEPGFTTSDMARRTPVSVPGIKPTTTVTNVSAQGKAPTLSGVASGLVSGLGKIAAPAVAGAQKAVQQMAPKPAAPKAAPSATPTASFVSNMLGATSGILGKVGSGIMGGISALSTPTPTMNQKLAAQVEAAKAKAAAPVAKQPSTVATVGQGLANLPKANPNKINTQGLSAAITGGLGGLLTGGLPGAATGALWGYATAPSGLNPMNANMAAVPQGGLLSDGIRGMSMQRVGTAPSGAGLYSAGNEINGVKQVFNTPNPSNAFGGMGYSLGGLGSLGNMFGGGSPSKSSDSKSQSKSSGGGWGAGSSRPTGGGAGGGLKSGPYGK